MTRYYTFEHADKASTQAHEHVTVCFANGTLLLLSRDETRSVNSKWDAIGTYGETHARWSYVSLTEDSKATRLFATQMKRSGYVTFGIEVDDTEWGAINVLHSNGRTTNPDSIRGDVRARSGKLGQPNANETGAYSFGKRYSCDVHAMRRAILTK